MPTTTMASMIDDEQALYHDMVTLGNDGKPIPAQVGAGGGYIPRGSKNVEIRQDLVKDRMQLKVMNENLKGGLGRWVPGHPINCKERSVLADFLTRTWRLTCSAWPGVAAR